MERKRIINGKTYYAKQAGGMAYELIDGEYIRSESYSFPHCCEKKPDDLPPMVIYSNPCQFCGHNGTIHG